ncbi:transcriptional regulator, TetR family [Sphingomonas sp. YR710]|jgi:TetR/AcrR family transcriptional repressor of mexJK operon|uniref:TetR/AcrR family transcriptional regulator n=1 Tax=Sphingomonas sp. YR710 TaxID=1882773 RepID=UPI00087E4387|nr:TetR/AcrR family transcriptional regulator [Sphingomonas sp. YR710]SDC53648.1 transcriptional regulator, TetR family [Sphingomonas sp. YR710]
MTGEDKQQSQTDRSLQYTLRRGRPTPSQAAEIDRSILSVARALFLSQGYAITSMEAVAAAAGVSKGTLYARYSSKGDLFKAIVAERLKAWAASSSDVTFDPAFNLEQRLLQRANAILDATGITEVRAFDRLISAEAGRFPELAKDFYDHGFAAVVNSVKNDFETVGGDSAGAILDSTAVARIFTAGLIGWFRIESTVGEVDEAQRRAFAGEMVALCMGSLARHPSAVS